MGLKWLGGIATSSTLAVGRKPNNRASASCPSITAVRKREKKERKKERKKETEIGVSSVSWLGWAGAIGFLTAVPKALV